MEKVKVTKEQAEAIEYLKKLLSDTSERKRNLQLIKEKLDHDYNWESPNFKAANEIPDDIFIAALHYGYEVEPEVGDWIILQNGKIGKIEWINYSKNLVSIYDCEVGVVCIDDIERHATPSEIAEEKERRWWAKLDRGVNEYKTTDIVQHVGMQGLYEVVNVFDTVHVELTKDFCDTSFTTTVDKLTLVCTAENRLDGDFGERD